MQIEKGAATVVLERPVATVAEAPVAAAALDFDLDLGAPAAAPVPQTPAPPPSASAKAESPAGLDFDLGMDFKAGSKQQAEYNPEATMILDVAKTAPPAADLELDIKLDEPVAPADEGLHFDLDLGAPVPSAAEVVNMEKTIPAEMRLISISISVRRRRQGLHPRRKRRLIWVPSASISGSRLPPPSLLQETKCQPSLSWPRPMTKWATGKAHASC